MYVYEPREDVLWQKLHPLPVLLYLLVLAGGAVFYTHPLLLWALLFPLSWGVIMVEGFFPWLRSLRFMWAMLAGLLFVNVLVNKMGATVLWLGPRLPGFGPLVLSAETLVFVVVMSLRLLVVFSAFNFANAVVNPDDVLSYSARIFPQSSLLLALTSRLIPLFTQRLRRVAEIQQCRGVNYHTGNYLNRVKNRLPLVKVVLLSSLEDSFNLGESIQSRAYGSGPRTSYYQGSLRRGDWLLFASTLMAVILMVRMQTRGLGNLQFYPRLGVLLSQPGQLRIYLLICASLLLPMLAAWGWKKWPCMKWKI